MYVIVNFILINVRNWEFYANLFLIPIMASTYALRAQKIFVARER